MLWEALAVCQVWQQGVVEVKADRSPPEMLATSIFKADLCNTDHLDSRGGPEGGGQASWWLPEPFSEASKGEVAYRRA